MNITSGQYVESRNSNSPICMLTCNNEESFCFKTPSMGGGRGGGGGGGGGPPT